MNYDIKSMEMKRQPLPIVIKKLKKVLKEVHHHQLAGPFQNPIKLHLAPGYLDIIKKPIDLLTIKKQIYTIKYV